MVTVSPYVTLIDMETVNPSGTLIDMDSPYVP